jgi:hypothetical protein
MEENIKPEEEFLKNDGEISPSSFSQTNFFGYIIRRAIVKLLSDKAK